MPVEQIGYGIDVSHHQDPKALPWEQYRGQVDFVIARASYGTMRDRHVEQHVLKARAIGAKVGVYFFFRPTQDLDDQFARLSEVMKACGMGEGDVVPAIDIEADPYPTHTEVSPSWDNPCRVLTDRMVETWGEAIVYITQRDWGLLGKPEWVLKRPLWCAHYTTKDAPATPGNKPVMMWQHRVGPFDPMGAGGYVKEKPELDQNRLYTPLPLIEKTDDLGEELRERAQLLAENSINEEAMRLVRGHAVDDDGQESV